MNQPAVQPVRVNALPVTQSGRPFQCFDCKGWGHKWVDYPLRRQSQGSHYQNPGPPRQLHNFKNQVRNTSNPNPVNQRPNPTPTKSIANYVSVNDELEEQAQIYAALDPRESTPPNAS